jgi:dTDP-4-amino-4,6-dideoxygalactose transaminase
MIRLNIPCLGPEELAEIGGVLDTGYLTQGKKVTEFEEAVKSTVGSRYGFAMSSATTALHLSLVTLGIKPGDEVLVSDFTFPASGNVIVQAGATPVCVDVLPDTYGMDPGDLERRITERTRAIMVVHPFGLPADMDPIIAIAKKHDLPIVEDAACALGSRYNDRFCGAMTELGCFSFHPRKSITTGEGGMVMTDDEALAGKIATLRSHGGRRLEWYVEFIDFGFNYRLSDVLAALGVAQMKRLQWLIDGKRERAAQLSRLLSDVEGLQLPVEPPGHFHTYQSYVTVLDDHFDRDAIIGAMREKGVETTIGTYAMHSQPAYRNRFGLDESDCPVSHRLYRQSLTLPLYPQMTVSDVEKVAESLRSVLESES